MNIQQIIQAATQKGVNNGKLTESINKARELLDSVNKPEETLSKINITPEFIQTIRSYVDNPMFSWIFPILKHSKEEVKRGLDRAEEYLKKKQIASVDDNYFNTNTTYQSSNVNNNSVDIELERFRKALSQIK